MPPTDAERLVMCSMLSRKIFACLDENVPDDMELSDVLATLFGVGVTSGRQSGLDLESLQAIWEAILLSQLQVENVDVKVLVIPPGGTTPVGSDGSVN